MSDSVRETIYEAIASIRLIDPHTHINPHAPASSTLADLLGYHYYTELAHSAGMPKSEIEEEGLQPRELVRRLVENLSPIENTAQYSWLVEICRMFFGFDGERIDTSNWEEVYDAAERQMGSAEWPQMVLDQSNVEAVFLTNDFDDELTGFDTETYIPCLRTDDLVFHLPKLSTRQRLAASSGIELDGSLGRLRDSLDQRFRHFVSSGARACAISLPPTFEPVPVSDGRAATALEQVLQKGPGADPAHQAALSRRIFWTLAELCDHYNLPFDLMIGVNRGVYGDGVFQGQDLYDSRVSLIQYRQLFNSFPRVKFPISVLASVTNQELVSYAWIFPNVITNGHWWYSNTPSFISRDAAARLEAVPQTKQIGYYSDAYKLEFVWPKFDMYRRLLAGILSDQFVLQRGWSEERAIELGRQVLRDNVDEIFPRAAMPETDEALDADSQATRVDPLAGTSAALAAGAIGMVEINEAGDAESDDDADDPGSSSQDQSDDDQGFSTLVMETDALTVNEEPSDLETVRIDDGDDASRSDEHGVLPDLPTKLDLDDTIRIDDSADAQSEQADAEFELDPLPSDDELEDAGVDDVELHEFSPESRGPDAEGIEAEADDDALDVGDIFADEGSEATSDSESEIRMLRGEDSFQPDEDSLQLRPDPVTGELTFPVAQSDQPSADGEDESDDIHATIDADEIAALGETIELAEIDLDEMDSDEDQIESLDEQDSSDDLLRP